MTGSPGSAVDDPAVPGAVLAAGVICWRAARRKGSRAGSRTGSRPVGGDLEVLLVHRPRDGDWSWPKGKVGPGETLPECAVRETAEETGASVVLGRPLATVRYPLPDGRPKQVDYWAARSLGSGQRSAPDTEIDRSRWLSAERAHDLLSRSGDLAPLTALLDAHREGTLVTRPLIVIRHGVARPKDSWARADADRPLVGAGRRQARALVPLLRCWRPEYLLSSPWRRCLETIAPYAATGEVRVRTKGGLSEDGFNRDPGKARKHVTQLLHQEHAAGLCTHRPVLGAVLGVLRSAADPQQAVRIPTTDPFLAPGAVLVTHAAGGPGAPRIVAVEHHDPPR